jgi:hypothetical protein
MTLHESSLGVETPQAAPCKVMYQGWGVQDDLRCAGGMCVCVCLAGGQQGGLWLPPTGLSTSACPAGNGSAVKAIYAHLRDAGHAI